MRRSLIAATMPIALGIVACTSSDRVAAPRALPPRALPRAAQLSAEGVLGCPPGFTLADLGRPVPGGEHPADRNVDGIICILDLSRDGEKRFVEIDNHLPASQLGACPDGAAGVKWPFGSAPDRNENGIVCLVIKNNGEPHYFDDNHR